jgi:hypothetical protein
MSYLNSLYKEAKAHWRGENSIAFSFWVIAIVVTPILIFLFSYGLEEIINLFLTGGIYADSNLAKFRVISFITNIIVFTWCYIGLWRSCTNNYPNTSWFKESNIPSKIGYALFNICARATLLILCIIISGTIIFHYKDVLNTIKTAFTWETQTPIYINGDRLEIIGEIQYDIANKIITLLNENPQITVIGIDSNGGLTTEARKIASAIKLRSLNTYSPNVCLSACTIVFMAGKERYVGEGIHFAFHRYRRYDTASISTNIHPKDISFFLQQGVVKDFLDNLEVRLSDHDWARPSIKSLLESHIVNGGIVLGDKIIAPTEALVMEWLNQSSVEKD